jgi:ribosome-associated protein
LYNNTTASQTINNSEALTNLIVDCIQDIKGKNIVKLDLREIDDSPTDFFIICDGESTTQIRAIAKNIRERVKDEIGLLPSLIEGQEASKWVLVDYFNIVVHVFYPETREFYELEDLWSDAIVTEFENI